MNEVFRVLWELIRGAAFLNVIELGYEKKGGSKCEEGHECQHPGPMHRPMHKYDERLQRRQPADARI